MNRLLPIMPIMGMIIMVFGLLLLVPIIVSSAINDGAAHAYDVALFLSLAGGAVVWLSTRRYRRELHARDGFLLVIAVWALLPIAGALPLYLYLPDLRWSHAYFEAVSGLTATGGTALSGLDSLPATLNLWRTLLHWVGGLGIIMLALAILPLIGVGGTQLYKAEMPGMTKDAKLTPRLSDTAKAFWYIYVTFTVLCALAFWAAGMPGLDAVMHAFSTMALGGFSSKDASLGHYNSPLIEAIAMLFMLVAATNFATHFMAWRWRRPWPYLKDFEIRSTLLALGVSATLVSLYLYATGTYATLAEAFRFGVFNTLSVATTLGFANADYSQWPIAAPLLMLSLSAFVCCAGSTGGGIKMARFLLMASQMMRETTLLLHPRAVAPVLLGGTVIPNQTVLAVLAFMSFYGLSILGLSFVLILTGLDPLTAISSIVACINNTGPGLGQAGPAANYGFLTDFQAYLCAFAMLLGRLELLTLFVLLNRAFWRV